MPTATISFVGSIAGLSIASQQTLTGIAQEGGQYPSATPEACTYGGLNPYDDLHTFEYDETPTVEAGDIIGVFWTGGRRVELEVEAVDGTTVTVHNDNIGQGDTLPASGTVMAACPRTRYDLRLDADQIVAFAAGMATSNALLVFRDDAASALVDVFADAHAVWLNTDGTTSPFASLGDMATVDVYAAAAVTVTLGFLQDSEIA